MDNIILGLSEMSHGIQSINSAIGNIASDPDRSLLWLFIVVAFVILSMRNARIGFSFLGIAIIIGVIFGGV